MQPYRLKLMYITNKPDVAQIADKYGVDRIWIDLETIGKEERQHGMDTVKSHHTMQDISNVRNVLDKAELLVRLNPLYEGTQKEVDEAVARGADILMLPMFRTAEDVARFVDIVGGRARVLLLLETVDAENNIEEIVKIPGVDAIHIGLNDLHLEHHQKFLFEPLADGTVDKICTVIRKAGIPYGFGGVATLDGGLLPGRMVLAEHFRLGSSMVILSRAFSDAEKGNSFLCWKRQFKIELNAIREYEKMLNYESEKRIEENRRMTIALINQISAKRSEVHS